MNLQTKLDEMRKRCEAAIEHVANARSEASAPMTSREYIIDECCHAVHYMDEIHKDLPLLISALQVCLGALEIYAKGDHFSFDGKEEFAPENPSGEPSNILCGGADGSEFTIEDGSLAYEALAKAEALAEGKDDGGRDG